MSLEASHVQRASSPASSGRSSPVNPRSRLGAEDALNKKDKNYRRYASAVERALSLFDTALQEWADYISFLARLLKVHIYVPSDLCHQRLISGTIQALQSRPSGIAEIPHKSLVARRLAQCLKPSLPSGVHQKTIEIYTYIFNVLGVDNLARDLSLYLPGLSPALSYASLSNKPALLSLFETHILALGIASLRPALKAIFLALLPGLEEETSEEFERTHSLLARLKIALGQGQDNGAPQRDASNNQYYWQCLFLASITSNSRRQGALAFMVRNLPRLGSSRERHGSSGNEQGIDRGPPDLEDDISAAAQAVINPEPGLLLRAFATGLRDEQLLIQRGFLDLLVTHLPLHSNVLQRIATRDDTDRLVAAAASVVARREMSLNRRLWTWFLGPEMTSESQSSTPVTQKRPASGNVSTSSFEALESHRSYFERFGLDSLVRSILKMIQSNSIVPSERARPFRICLSLMDRWEIGSTVVPQLLIPLLESLWRYERIAASRESFEEVFRSASVFFDGVESGLIWGEIERVLTSSLGNHQTLEDHQGDLGLVYFIVTKFNVREEEMQTLHMPMITLVIVIYLRKLAQESSDLAKVDSAELEQTALKLALTLLDSIPERAFVQGAAAPPSKASEEATGGFIETSENFLNSVQRFYGQYQWSIGRADVPCSSESIGQLLLQNTVQLILQELRTRRQFRQVEMELLLLEKASRKIARTDGIDRKLCLSALVQALVSINSQQRPPTSIESITTVASALDTFSAALPSEIWNTDHQTRQVITDLVVRLWPWLSPSKPSNNVEAARCIWRLQLISPDIRLIEGCIAKLMSEDSQLPFGGTPLEGARRFATLWAHSNSSIKNLHSRHPINSRTTRLDIENYSLSPNPEMVMLGRPMMLLLDSLFEARAELFNFTTSWLQSLPTLDAIIQWLVHRLRMSKFLISCSTATRPKAKLPATYDLSDLRDCQYVLQTILNIVVCSPGNIWASLAISNPLSAKKLSPGAESTWASLAMSSASEHLNIQSYLIYTCLTVLRERLQEDKMPISQVSSLRQTASSLLQHVLLGVGQLSMPVLPSTIESTVIEALTQSIGEADTLLQVPLMNLLVIVLRMRSAGTDDGLKLVHQMTPSGDRTKSLQRLSTSAETMEKDEPSEAAPYPLPALLDCLLYGLSSPNSYPVLDHWVQFLDDCLPFYAENAFHILMPLVNCFNKTMRTVFELLRAEFEGQEMAVVTYEPLLALHSLFNGLERSLARAHERLVQHEAGVLALKTPEQSQGFFGNMVSGVFSPEPSKLWSNTANNRLTVLLCFKDAILVCLDIWTWASHGQSKELRESTSSASLSYASIRMKNRTRRILEHLFAAEALECLETLVEVWCQTKYQGNTPKSLAVFNLLHVLDGSRPKNTIPALFNAMYSRTNPNALEPGRKSSLIADLSDAALADFLVAYMRSLEDDAMDEIWSDCMTFLKDVLGNPLPQRQTLPRLLEFTAILGEKVNNTNFGEQRRMRQDLGDLFVRLLAAAFTAKPLNFAQIGVTALDNDGANMQQSNPSGSIQSNDIISIVVSILPNLSRILVDADRVAAASSIIALQILTPTIQSKLYPHNMLPSILDIFLTMSRISEVAKVWRKIVAEAFNDPRFFCASSLKLAEEGWMPVLRQWTLLDKDRMKDYVSRLMPPTAAGIMFGVGASSARLEADRKTQLVLRRMALLVLAATDDAYVMDIDGIQEKVLELLTATAASSPSSATRAELYMLLRALVLKTSAVHMTSFWPTISSELFDALSSLFLGEQHDTYSLNSALQACKLLDTLVTLAPDEFQLREWLFITDTVDAVYRPHAWRPVALVDELAENLDSYSGIQNIAPSPSLAIAAPTGKRRPLLNSENVRDVSMGAVVDSVLRPFFRQISINAFESTYGMEVPDWKACYDILLCDLFDDSTMA